MPDDFLDRMELAKRIEEMPDRQLLEFTAKQVYEVSVQVVSQRKRIEKLESRSRKEVGASGGIGAVIGVIIASIADYFLRR